MCESGSTARLRSVDFIGNPFEIATIFDVKFSCVSITPFGSPVVPDV